jgi:hypothetical protein
LLEETEAHHQSGRIGCTVYRASQHSPERGVEGSCSPPPHCPAPPRAAGDPDFPQCRQSPRVSWAGTAGFRYVSSKPNQMRNSNPSWGLGSISLNSLGQRCRCCKEALALLCWLHQLRLPFKIRVFEPGYRGGQRRPRSCWGRSNGNWKSPSPSFISSSCVKKPHLNPSSKHP